MTDQRDQEKAWGLMEKAILASVEEQRRARRWRLFILLFVLVGYPVFLMTVANSAGDMKMKGPKSNLPHTAYVRVYGPIMDEAETNANAIVGGLRDAFENENAKAIVLGINSPGGSPVQAGYVFDEIFRLRAEYPDKKVYAVISELGASAAYYIAAAADEIYADKASLVGSIGVISASFGFDGALDKLGVERRVITAGENKAFLDPYQPLKESDKAFWEESLEVVHQQFIEQVKRGRGDRLLDEEIFSL